MTEVSLNMTSSRNLGLTRQPCFGIPCLPAVKIGCSSFLLLMTLFRRVTRPLSKNLIATVHAIASGGPLRKVGLTASFFISAMFLLGSSRERDRKLNAQRR